MPTGGAAPSVLQRRIRSKSKTEGKLKAGELAYAATLCLSIGMVLLILFDWLYDFEIIPLPVSLYIRALSLAVFSLYLIHTEWRFETYHFQFGQVLFYYLTINLLYSCFSGHILGNLYFTSRIAFWILGTVVAYRLALTGVLTTRILRRAITATVLLGAAFTIYFMTRPNVEAGQNASAYLLVWCLPLLLTFDRSRLNIIILAVAVAAILLTVKRGAMMASVFSLIAYGLTYVKIRGNSSAFRRIIGPAIVLAIVSFYSLTYNWDAVKNRFEDTSGSGRDNVYSMLWSHWIESGPTNWVFGFGINSVQSYTGLMFGSSDGSGAYAHSDWLQLMHDFGLLGIGFLVWLHLRFLSVIRTAYRWRLPCAPSLVMGYTVLFLVNIYSGHLMGPNAIYFGLLAAVSSENVNRVTERARHTRTASNN